MNFYKVADIEELAGDILIHGLKTNLEVVFQPFFDIRNIDAMTSLSLPEFKSYPLICFPAARIRSREALSRCSSSIVSEMIIRHRIQRESHQYVIHVQNMKSAMLKQEHVQNVTSTGTDPPCCPAL